MILDYQSFVNRNRFDITLNLKESHAFLKAIGYEVGQEFWLRCANNDKKHPSYSGIAKGILTEDSFKLWDCRKVNHGTGNKSRWVPNKAVVPGNYLTQFDNVFVIANPSKGISKADVYQFHCGFFECDVKAIDEQFQVISDLQSFGINPNAVVFTGGKSLHVYYRFERPISSEQWIEVQRKLTVFADSDASAVSVSHFMRLPGVYRVNKKHEKHKVELIHLNAETTLTLDKFNQALNAFFPFGIGDDYWKAFKASGTEGQRDTNSVLEFIPPFEVKTNLNDTIIPRIESKTLDLTVFISSKNRDVLFNGAAKGSRATSGIALAKDLFGCEYWLLQHNHTTAQSSHSLIKDYCNRVGLTQTEYDGLISSACMSSEPAKSESVLLATLKRELDAYLEPDDAFDLADDEVHQALFKLGGKVYNSEFKLVKPDAYVPGKADATFYGFNPTLDAETWQAHLDQSHVIHIVRSELKATQNNLKGIPTIAIRHIKAYEYQSGSTTVLNGVLTMLKANDCALVVDEDCNPKALGYLYGYSKVKVKTVLGTVLNLTSWLSLKRFSFTPNKTVDLVSINGKSYLPDGIMDSENLLTSVKADMGNGKTYQTMLTVQRWIQANPSGVVIPLTNRRSTGSKLANDLKQIGVDAGELKEIVTGLNVPASGLDSFWSCLESLAKLDLTDLNPERPTFIILDEWNQVLWSLLNSATIKEREVIIGRFKALLTDVVAANPNSRILALDEANNDICTEYLESILGVKALKIEAVKVAKGLNLFVHTSPYDVLGLAILDILDGKRPYINVSGAGEDSKFSVHNVNALLQAVCPGKVGLALNSTNCKVKGTAESEALEDITQACLKADYVIANSVIESNFSIDACVEFSARYVINPGVTSTMFTAFQMPARPRYACPIHVWFPEKVQHVKGAYIGTGSPFKGALRNEFISDAKSILRTLSKLNLDINLSFKDIPKQTDESTWLDYASLINATKGDWLQVQLHLYKSYGYSVKPGIATDSKWIKEELGYIKVEESDARNQAVERVQALSEAEYDVVSRKPKKSLDEHNAVTKTLVARKALLEPESVKADDVQAYFNRDFDIMHAVYDVLHLIDTVDRDTFHLEQIKHYGLSPFKLDLIKGLRRNAAKVWNKVDFQKVLQPLVNGEAFVTSEHDELIRDFGEYCYRLPIADSWKYLGSHWSKTPNLKDDVAAGKIRFESDESYKRIGWFLIKKALGKFGLKLERYRKTRVNGSQIWQYVAVQANSENLIQGFTPAMLSFYERLSDKRHDDKLKRNEIRDERNPVKPLAQSLETLEFTSSYII